MESNGSALSVLAQYDDIKRNINVLLDGGAEEAFLSFASQLEMTRERWQVTAEEKQRLQRELDAALKSMVDLEAKLNNARKLLELENKARREAEHERDALENRLYKLKEFLDGEDNLKEETRNKLDFLSKLNKRRKSARLSALEEQHSFADINSTGSILSDLSLTRSENDFLDRPSMDKRRWRKSRSLAAEGASNTPKRKSGKTLESQRITHCTGKEKIVAVSKVTVPQDDGPILAESCIEAIPSNQEPSETIYKTPMKAPAPRKMQNATAPPMPDVFSTPSRGRPHDFEEKSFFMNKLCNHCQKNIRFGQMGFRCKTCHINCHIEPCSRQLDIVCAPPSAQKYLYGKLSDYVTPWKPMVPALLIHCVTEIEKRGLKEKGLYRVNGSDREIKALKEKFLRSKNVPCLKETDINVLCGCVKDFLRSLQEKLIPDDKFTDFSNAVQQPNPADTDKVIKKIISSLAEANRDTLAFIVIHLQKIAESPEVQMPLESLAKVFAPTLVGASPSTTIADENRFIIEAYLQVEILKGLFSIPTHWWGQLINPASSSDETTTDERGGQSDGLIFKNLKRKKKFYDTPPPMNKQRK